MSVPAGVEADRGPPMTIPLVHFVVGFGFLLAGAVLGVLSVVGTTAGLSGIAHVHLLLIGWACVTIMGAMTQFVPVWSGAELYSRRLAVVQLGLVAVGVASFATLLVAGRPDWLFVAGLLMLTGFWVFAYNIGRTLWGVVSASDDGLRGALDVTERHFALALGYLLLVTSFGFLLALGYVWPGALGGFARSRVVATHATLAVFGIVLTTVVGALYQLATMFTQTELHGIDVTLRRFEEWTYPIGVLALAGGRLLGHATLARVGGALVLASLLSFAVVLGRKLYETRVQQTPMLTRYAVVAVSLGLWVVVTVPAWLSNPADPATTFGPPNATHLLLAVVVGFVLLGTLYHVVPFIIWVRQYSDRVGLEPVPMIDDLYDDRLAAVDFWLTLGGLSLVVLGGVADVQVVRLVGGVAATVGFAVFALNLVGVVVRHGPESLRIGALAETEKSSDEQFP